MILRPARQADLPALIDLAKRSWLSGFVESAPEAFVREWLARDFESDWYPKHWPSMTVAEVDSVILGVVQPAADEINGLWVDPAAQGRGVGTALLAHGEGQIVAAGHDRAWLSCSGFNLKGKRFYLARGYTLIRSETKQRASGVIEEMHIYERRLPRPAAA
jgi:ribosomal protein S18 acetylase RimI-like enzyme